MSKQHYIPNIANYNFKIINGDLILEEKKHYIPEDELLDLDLKFSGDVIVDDCDFLMHESHFFL